MTRTVQVIRSKTGKAVSATDLVHSPDDGGYYFSQHNFKTQSHRVSEGIYFTERAALQDFRSGKVTWESRR